jgi:hypothetical protein
MMVLCGTKIRHIRLLVHLISGDLAGDVEEDEDLSGRHLYGVVDLVRFTRVTSLVLEASDRFKGSEATTSALGRLVLKDTCTKTSRLSNGNSGASAARSDGSSCRLVVQAISIIFKIFKLPCTSYKLIK